MRIPALKFPLPKCRARAIVPASSVTLRRAVPVPAVGGRPRRAGAGSCFCWRFNPALASSMSALRDSHARALREQEHRNPQRRETTHARPASRTIRRDALAAVRACGQPTMPRGSDRFQACTGYQPCAVALKMCSREVEPFDFAAGFVNDVDTVVFFLVFQRGFCGSSQRPVPCELVRLVWVTARITNRIIEAHNLINAIHFQFLTGLPAGVGVGLPDDQ